MQEKLRGMEEAEATEMVLRRINHNEWDKIGRLITFGFSCSYQKLLLGDENVLGLDLR